jgi:hypothetical protein
LLLSARFDQLLAAATTTLASTPRTASISVG